MPEESADIGSWLIGQQRKSSDTGRGSISTLTSEFRVSDSLYNEAYEESFVIIIATI